MTIGQFQTLVNNELPAIAAVLSPPNPQRSGAFQYANINYAKQGVEIYPQISLCPAAIRPPSVSSVRLVTPWC